MDSTIDLDFEKPTDWSVLIL